MAGKLNLIKAAIVLLLGSGTMSANEKSCYVEAASTGNKIIRIDLEKHYIPHVEIEDIEESEEDNGQIHIELKTDNFA